MPEDEIEKGVWSDNVEATLAFLSVQTQWRWRPHGLDAGQIAGLDYCGVRTGLDAAGFTVSPELWADILMIEAGALDAKNKDN